MIASLAALAIIVGFWALLTRGERCRERERARFIEAAERAIEAHGRGQEYPGPTV